MDGTDMEGCADAADRITASGPWPEGALDPAADQAVTPCRQQLDLSDASRQECLMLISQMEQQIHDYKCHIQRLEQRLNIHPKTGLRNQYRMQRELDGILEQVRSDAEYPQRALCIFRLDSNFDVLNKTFKPSVSDWILYQIGIRLEELVFPGERIYHTRDDEFVAILARFSSGISLANRVESMLTAIQKPHVLAGRHLLIGANVGIARYPANGSHRSVLLHAADLALDKAILEQRRFCFFEDEIRNTALRRMDLHTSLVNALESNADLESASQFSIAYQPLVYMTRSPDGQFRCSAMDAEVLLRWKHPSKGSISPEEFIPFSEESGLILPIGNWVIYQVLKQLAAWSNGPLRQVCLSVNISPKQFLNDELMRNLARQLRQNPGLHRRLKLEITETCLLENPELSIQRMQYLNKLGLRFSLDDFGQGYSSLSHLSRLPLDSIKLDRQFVQEAETKPASQAIIKAVLLMASRMKLKLICEGVETLPQLSRLLKEGARGFQGYYFSKPVGPKAFERLHESRSRIRIHPDRHPG